MQSTIKGHFRVKNALVVPFIGNKASTGPLNDPRGAQGETLRGIPVHVLDYICKYQYHKVHTLELGAAVMPPTPCVAPR